MNRLVFLLAWRASAAQLRGQNTRCYGYQTHPGYWAFPKDDAATVDCALSYNACNSQPSKCYLQECVDIQTLLCCDNCAARTNYESEFDCMIGETNEICQYTCTNASGAEVPCYDALLSYGDYPPSQGPDTSTSTAITSNPLPGTTSAETNGSSTEESETPEGATPEDPEDDDPPDEEEDSPEDGENAKAVWSITGAAVGLLALGGVVGVGGYMLYHKSRSNIRGAGEDSDEEGSWSAASFSFQTPHYVIKHPGPNKGAHGDNFQTFSTFFDQKHHVVPSLDLDVVNAGISFAKCEAPSTSVEYQTAARLSPSPYLPPSPCATPGVTPSGSETSLRTSGVLGGATGRIGSSARGSVFSAAGSPMMVAPVGNTHRAMVGQKTMGRNFLRAPTARNVDRLNTTRAELTAWDRAITSSRGVTPQLTIELPVEKSSLAAGERRSQFARCDSTGSSSSSSSSNSCTSQSSSSS